MFVFPFSMFTGQICGMGGILLPLFDTQTIWGVPLYIFCITHCCPRSLREFCHQDIYYWVKIIFKCFYGFSKWQHDLNALVEISEARAQLCIRWCCAGNITDNRKARFKEKPYWYENRTFPVFERVLWNISVDFKGRFVKLFSFFSVWSNFHWMKWIRIMPTWIL